MFQTRTISNELTYNFWKMLCKESNEKRLGEQLFQFSKDSKNALIKIKNEGLILNPEIDFLQAKVVTDEKKIIIETSRFIKWLYIGLIIFTFLFALLQIKYSIIAAIAVILIFGLIYLYNYRKINKAIIKFESTLEYNARYG